MSRKIENIIDELIECDSLWVISQLAGKQIFLPYVGELYHDFGNIVEHRKNFE